jgi:hypothetical protein
MYRIHLLVALNFGSPALILLVEKSDAANREICLSASVVLGYLLAYNTVSRSLESYCTIMYAEWKPDRTVPQL